MQYGSKFFGMDVEQVTSVAGSLDGQVARINSILSSLTSKLSATPWTGPDRDRFVEQWSSVHVPAIKKASEDIRVTVAKVRSDISAQQNTSMR